MIQIADDELGQAATASRATTTGSHDHTDNANSGSSPDRYDTLFTDRYDTLFTDGYDTLFTDTSEISDISQFDLYFHHLNDQRYVESLP